MSESPVPRKGAEANASALYKFTMHTLALISLALCSSFGAPSVPGTLPGIQQAEKKAAPKLTTIRAAIQSFAGALPAKAKQTPFRVGVANFTFENTGVPSAFAGYIEGEISTALAFTKSFEQYARRNLEAIMTEQGLSFQDIFDRKGAPSPGLLKAVHGIIVGDYWANGAETIVHMRLLDVESGRVLSSSSIVMANLLPAIQKSVEPPALKRTKKALADFLEGDNLDQFGIKLWLDRGDGALYHAKERLQISFQTEVDCYLRLYHLSADDELQIIFPNALSERSLLKKGQLHVFPGKGIYEFELGEPFGTELIYALASSVPFSTKELTMTKLGGAGDIKKVRTRGLKITAKKGKLAEKTCVYTIVK